MMDERGEALWRGAPRVVRLVAATNLVVALLATLGIALDALEALPGQGTYSSASRTWLLLDAGAELSMIGMLVAGTVGLLRRRRWAIMFLLGGPFVSVVFGLLELFINTPVVFLNHDGPDKWVSAGLEALGALMGLGYPVFLYGCLLRDEVWEHCRFGSKATHLNVPDRGAEPQPKGVEVMGSKVLLLGAGAMGALAAKTISAYDEVGELIVASLNRASVEKTALMCQGAVSAEIIDVTDRPALVALMRKADVVMNCVGPFFRFGVPVLEAAIEAGVDYLDICDDPQPTKEMLDLNEQARVAGVTAIIGMGASPGINNMLGACVRERLDEVDQLIAGWNIEEKTDDKLEFSAAIIHWMEQCSGAILECQGGRLVDGEPLEDMTISYPGRGKRTIYTVGHPEPVSFHYSWPEVKETHCGMVMPSFWISEFRKLRDAIDSGEMTLEQAGKRLVEGSSKTGWIDALLTALSRLVDGPRLPLFFVLGKGKRDGQPKTIAASMRATPPDMATMTGIPLALGTLMHLRGQTLRKGVVAPEKAFEPKAFFELLAPYCTMPRPCPASELVELVEE